MAGGLSEAVPGRHCHLGLSHGISPGAGNILSLGNILPPALRPVSPTWVLQRHRKAT